MSRLAVQVLERAEKPKTSEVRPEILQALNEQDEDMDIESEEDDEELEKDETEVELERLIFGDSAGFRDGLEDVALVDEEDEEDTEVGGLEGLDDADVGQALGH